MPLPKVHLALVWRQVVSAEDGLEEEALEVSERQDVFLSRHVECAVYPGERLASGDRAKVTCRNCLGIRRRRPRKPRPPLSRWSRFV